MLHDCSVDETSDDWWWQIANGPRLGIIEPAYSIIGNIILPIAPIHGYLPDGHAVVIGRGEELEGDGFGVPPDDGVGKTIGVG